MFGKNEDERIEKYCAFCELGTPVPSQDGTNYVLCKKKGLVKETYVCRKFIYDPLKRDPKRKKELPEFEPVKLDEKDEKEEQVLNKAENE